MSRHTASGFPRGTRLFVGASLLLAASANPAFAVFIDPQIPIPTQLLSFGPIQGDVFLPLTNAATTSTEAGAPAAVDGYGWVNSNIAITLSSQRQSNPGAASVGRAFLGVPSAFPTVADVVAAAVAAGCADGVGQAGNVNTGGTVCVNSFFDVFFDVTVTDIDATAGFLGGQGPQSVALLDQGPTFLQQRSECIADASQPNLGCLPPVGSAYIGHFQVVLPLGVDVNGNGADDVIKFDFVAHDVGGVTNTFIQGANVIDTFNSTINGGGSVEDALADPPFTFTLTGPTTAQQRIVFPAQVPEPGTLALMAAGLGFVAWQSRRKAA